MRLGATEEGKQSTTVSEEEDGGGEEEIEEDEGPRPVASLIIPLGLSMTLALEDLQRPAGPGGTLSSDHEPTEDDTTWLPGDARSLPVWCRVHCKRLDFYLHLCSQVVQTSGTRDLSRPCALQLKGYSAVGGQKSHDERGGEGIAFLWTNRLVGRSSGMFVEGMKSSRSFGFSQLVLTFNFIQCCRFSNKKKTVIFLRL